MTNKIQGSQGLKLLEESNPTTTLGKMWRKSSYLGVVALITGVIPLYDVCKKIYDKIVGNKTPLTYQKIIGSLIDKKIVQGDKSFNKERETRSLLRQLQQRVNNVSQKVLAKGGENSQEKIKGVWSALSDYINKECEARGALEDFDVEDFVGSIMSGIHKEFATSLVRECKLDYNSVDSKHDLIKYEDDIKKCLEKDFGFQKKEAQELVEEALSNRISKTLPSDEDLETLRLDYENNVSPSKIEKLIKDKRVELIQELRRLYGDFRNSYKEYYSDEDRFAKEKTENEKLLIDAENFLISLKQRMKNEDNKLSEQQKTILKDSIKNNKDEKRSIKEKLKKLNENIHEKDKRLKRLNEKRENYEVFLRKEFLLLAKNEEQGAVIEQLVSAVKGIKKDGKNIIEGSLPNDESLELLLPEENIHRLVQKKRAKEFTHIVDLRQKAVEKKQGLKNKTTKDDEENAPLTGKQFRRELNSIRRYFENKEQKQSPPIQNNYTCPQQRAFNILRGNQVNGMNFSFCPKTNPMFHK